MKKMLCFLIMTTITVNHSYVRAASITDSSSITLPSNPPASFMGSYVIYQSNLIHLDNPGYVTKNTYNISQTCQSGWYACVSTQFFDLNDLNPSECYFDRPMVEAGINSSGGGYTITSLFGASTTSFVSSSCNDRGGDFTYTVSCYPAANIDPAATSTVISETINGTKITVGTVCVQQP